MKPSPRFYRTIFALQCAITGVMMVAGIVETIADVIDAASRSVERLGRRIDARQGNKNGNDL